MYTPLHGNAGDHTYIRRGPGGRTGACEGYAQCDLIDFETTTVEGLKRIARRWGLCTSGLREDLVRPGSLSDDAERQCRQRGIRIFRILSKLHR